jgi:hypothetical protein
MPFVHALNLDTRAAPVKSIILRVTPWNRVVLENLRATRLFRKPSASYGIPRWITESIRFRQWTQSWTIWIWSATSYSISSRSILILSSHLRLNGVLNSLRTFYYLHWFYCISFTSYVTSVFPIFFIRGPYSSFTLWICFCPLLPFHFFCFLFLSHFLTADLQLQNLYNSSTISSRSQRPRGLMHEMSSPGRTLGPWIRIPLKAMNVCLRLFCVSVVLCR